MAGFREKSAAQRVFRTSAHGRATPHLHIHFIPFTTGSKRGSEPRVSLKQALAAQGFQGGNRGDTEWNQWCAQEKDQLSAAVRQVNRRKERSHTQHLSVLDYKNVTDKSTAPEAKQKKESGSWSKSNV